MMQSGADERILDITPELRLRRYAGECDFALEWYSDPELVLGMLRFPCRICRL